MISGHSQHILPIKLYTNVKHSFEGTNMNEKSNNIYMLGLRFVS